MDLDDARSPSAELAGETDADLFVYMSMSADEPQTARAAWEEFYRRHATYVYRVCLRAYSELVGGEAGVCDLVADTFRLAFETAHLFDPARVQDPERLPQVARAWLGRIARRRVLTLLRGRWRLPERFLDLRDWQQVAAPEPPQPAAGPPSPAVAAVREALLALNKREQMVIRVTFQWYQPERAHQRLPSEAIAELADALQTTPENLRQIRRRALRKIAAHVRRHSDASCAAEGRADE